MIRALTAALLLVACSRHATVAPRPLASSISKPASSPSTVPRPPAPLEVPPREVEARNVERRAAGGPQESRRPALAFETAPSGPGQRRVTLNFLDAPLETVVQAMSDLAAINYVLGPGVQGRVTIATQAPIPEDQVLGVLLAVLEVHGFTAIASGAVHKIVRTEGARERAVPSHVGAPVHAGRFADEVATQIVPLRAASATDLAARLRPLVSARGYLGVHRETNSLLLTDTISNLDRLLGLVRVLDVARVAEGLEILALRFADAVSLAATLNQVFARRGGADLPPLIIGERTSNALILHGRGEERERIRRLVAQLDVDARSGRQLVTYRAEHASAAELASTLRAVYEGTADQPRIVADAATNTLWVLASPGLWAAVHETLQQLDRFPRQVMIEVLVAEVSVTDEQRFGIDWVAAVGGLRAASLTSPVPPVDVVLSLLRLARPPSQGLSALVIDTGAFLVLLRALASANRIDARVTPRILVREGKQASLNVSESIPVVTSQSRPGGLPPGLIPSGVSLPEALASRELPAGLVQSLLGATTQTVEYRDVGVTLKVSPKLGASGAITLDVRQEVNQLGDADLATGSRQILKRELETSVVLHDTQSLVLGGLVRTRRDIEHRGVPILKDIPFVGRLFSRTEEQVSRRELLVLLTARLLPAAGR